MTHLLLTIAQARQLQRTPEDQWPRWTEEVEALGELDLSPKDWTAETLLVADLMLQWGCGDEQVACQLNMNATGPLWRRGRKALEPTRKLRR